MTFGLSPVAVLAISLWFLIIVEYRGDRMHWGLKTIFIIGIIANIAYFGSIIVDELQIR